MCKCRDVLREEEEDMTREDAIEFLIATQKISPEHMMELLEALSPEQKMGHWIESDDTSEKYTCSNCGGACWYYDYRGTVAKSNYCPNCGARMEAGE